MRRGRDFLLHRSVRHETYDDTELFTRAVLCRTIGARHELTLYTRHGDWLGEACSLDRMPVRRPQPRAERVLHKRRTRLWRTP